MSDTPKLLTMTAERFNAIMQLKVEDAFDGAAKLIEMRNEIQAQAARVLALEQQLTQTAKDWVDAEARITALEQEREWIRQATLDEVAAYVRGLREPRDTVQVFDVLAKQIASLPPSGEREETR